MGATSASSTSTLTRRRFVVGGALVFLGGACRGRDEGAPADAVRAGAPGRELLLSPEREHGGLPFSLGVLDLRTGRVQSVPLDLLGHSVVGHPKRRHLAVVLGQRPGRLSCVVDLDRGRVVRKFEAGAGRHFYGHGTFSPDGGTLYTTENLIADGAGVIVARDTGDWSVRGELPSHGLGPHHVQPLDGGRTFLVANGGLPTDPAASAPEVPYEAMDASLVIVDAVTGALRARHRATDAHVSVRHLATAPDGSFAAGLNRFGPSRVTPMVLARSGADGPVVEMTPPPSLALRMSGTLSLCIAPEADIVGVTSKGATNLVTFWHLRRGAFAGHLDIPAPNGITLDDTGGRFLVTTASGELHAVDTRTLRPVPSPWAGRALNWRHSGRWRT